MLRVTRRLLDLVGFPKLPLDLDATVAAFLRAPAARA